MKKALVVLAIGIAVGYWLGFQDAQMNRDNIVVRIIQSTGGANRANFRGPNVDRQLDSLSK